MFGVPSSAQFIVHNLSNLQKHLLFSPTKKQKSNFFHGFESSLDFSSEFLVQEDIFGNEGDICCLLIQILPLGGIIFYFRDPLVESFIF